jgi:hypothetical protein
MEVLVFFLEFQHHQQRQRGVRRFRMNRIDMAKSALLGRLMRGEELRRRPCPKHKGVMWCSWGIDEAMKPCACEGTGWLPNEPGDNIEES